MPTGRCQRPRSPKRIRTSRNRPVDREVLATRSRFRFSTYKVPKMRPITRGSQDGQPDRRRVRGPMHEITARHARRPRDGDGEHDLKRPPGAQTKNQFREGNDDEGKEEAEGALRKSRVQPVAWEIEVHGIGP